MNILGLIFSLLLILSFSFYTIMYNHRLTSEIKKSYLLEQTTHRSFQNTFASEMYAKLKAKKKDTPKSQKKIDRSINQPCSKINLYPLVLEGKENHRELYDIVAKLIKTFYSPLFPENKSFEFQILDKILSQAKKASSHNPFAFEKLDLEEFHPVYYKMLKGCKKYSIEKKIGYPSLLDFIKFSPSVEKICLYHANKELISALFNANIANDLIQELDNQDDPRLSKELIEKIALDHLIIALDQNVLNLLDLNQKMHELQEKTLIVLEKDTCMKKTINLNR